MATKTDSELGRALLTYRGIQWIIGTKGDPYALLLRVASDDPHELGRQIRDRGPLYWSSAGVWVTADHELGAAALRDSRLGSRPPTPDPPAGEAEDEPMPWDVPVLRDVLPLGGLPVERDRAEYTRLHRLVEPLAGGDAAQRRTADVTDTYQRLAAGLDERFDLMTDLARPAAAAFAGALLGLPPERHARFAELHEGAVGLLDATLIPPNLRSARALTAALSGMSELLEEHVEPGRDGLLGLPSPEPGDVLAASMLFAVVGAETAANLVCNALAALLDDPAQWKLLRDDPGLAPAAVEETLRYAPPIRLRRLYATEDFELAGRQVETGNELVVVVEAANRDPRVHTDPDRFDIQRTSRAEHLSLSGDDLYPGIIAPMVRMQAAAGVRAIAAAWPEIARTGDVLRRLRSAITAGVLRFPVSGK
ncbi:P450-derived glycosyltransferase activator [Actinomadura craniellae]|uniref:P450-derived glycosyltransferase activator n=1 Tax=Actinomadura craniellae TaxID=2231787 RepID=A0A365H0V0_9ACTN|nr:P450-derived glycosyltransferase activator [Actinomadura craniellae]RAY12714.1 P450-derived glycosyltransferase activator [Actinomadura craniellae]